MKPERIAVALPLRVWERVLGWAENNLDDLEYTAEQDPYATEEGAEEARRQIRGTQRIYRYVANKIRPEESAGNPTGKR